MMELHIYVMVEGDGSMVFERSLGNFGGQGGCKKGGVGRQAFTGASLLQNIDTTTRAREADIDFTHRNSLVLRTKRLLYSTTVYFIK